jgi:hypothetical protein
MIKLADQVIWPILGAGGQVRDYRPAALGLPRSAQRQMTLLLVFDELVDNVFIGR